MVVERGRRAGAVAGAVLVVVGLFACGGGMAAKESRDRTRMLEAARAVAAEESAFTAESLAFVATITVDTVMARFDSTPPPPAESDDAAEPDARWQERRWFVRSPRGSLCEVERERYDRLAPGDTLRCQWSAPR